MIEQDRQIVDVIAESSLGCAASFAAGLRMMVTPMTFCRMCSSNSSRRIACARFATEAPLGRAVGKDNSRRRERFQGWPSRCGGPAVTGSENKEPA